MNSLFLLISIYEDTDACTQKKISQRWQMPKQTVHAILKDFEKKGMVELCSMQEDERNKRIRFTSDGKKYADTVITRLRNMEIFKNAGGINDAKADA